MFNLIQTPYIEEALPIDRLWEVPGGILINQLTGRIVEKIRPFSPASNFCRLCRKGPNPYGVLSSVDDAGMASVVTECVLTGISQGSLIFETDQVDNKHYIYARGMPLACGGRGQAGLWIPKVLPSQRRVGVVEGHFSKGIVVRWDLEKTLKEEQNSQAKLVTMPNGQTGVLCEKCQDFYPYIDTPNFICRSCRT